ncbi:MAG TPA: STAS/SEC14 domain-containing protein [Planctomycetota bacterium]|nr:STAS/SEC14 domain-containing protein [Planctomycetota bacterium]
MGVVFTEREGFLEAVLWNTDSFPLLKQQIAEVLEACIVRKPPRLLVDMTAIEGVWSTMDRFEIGTLGAQLAPHVGRIAALTQNTMIDPEKFGAQVARNRGLTVDVFDDREKAVAWLLGPA